MTKKYTGPIPTWKVWIVDRLGLARHLYLGPEGIEQALRDKLHQGKQIEWQKVQHSHPDCIACPLWQAKHTDPVITLTPEQVALKNLIGTKTLPTLKGEMARKFYRKFYQQQERVQ